MMMMMMTCDQEIKGSTRSQALLCSHLGPVIHTCGPLSQSSISWQWPMMALLHGWVGNHGPGGK